MSKPTPTGEWSEIAKALRIHAGEVASPQGTNASTLINNLRRAADLLDHPPTPTGQEWPDVIGSCSKAPSEPTPTGQEWTPAQEARIRIVNYLGGRVKSTFRRYEEDEIERIINAALAKTGENHERAERRDPGPAAQ